MVYAWNPSLVLVRFISLTQIKEPQYKSCLQQTGLWAF